MSFSYALNLILLLVGLLVFYRIIKGSGPLEFWHLVSTRSADGIIYTDNDKVGQMTGLVFGTWVVCWMALTHTLEIWYFAAWLLYASGMGAFSKWARAMISDRYGSRGKEPEKTDQPGTISATTPAGGTMKMTP